VLPVTVILSGGDLLDGHLPYLLAAAASGAMTGVMTLGLLPLFELLFDETTDPRLLELASADSPLLKELALKAPGTYYHATMVANLAEAGADAVGANGLCCRVMALYHDIGKIRRPSYFAENQRDGVNIHDRLPPDVSARVLFAHIRDGIDIAREARLGGTILAAITQHQGTGLLRGFYEKALARGYNGAPENYRYPGPRPRQRETGILLLADSIEAATRATKDPSPAALREQIRQLIAERIQDGQLDECGLTLRDLAALEEVFTRTLALGVFHNRIDYPPVARSGGAGSKDDSDNSHRHRLPGLVDRSA
jgi:putative nucleotidyltransferase with HDIG domain